MLPPSHPPAPDFERIFQAAPGLYLVLTPDLEIVAVSESYLAATMTKREAIVGKGLFEVFPDNPDDPRATGKRNLSSSLKRVLDIEKPDTMAVQKYDIRRPDHEGGGFEERYWSPINSPVFGDDGRVAYIIHRVEDVTEFVLLEQQGREQVKVAEQLRAQTERMGAEVFRRAQEIQEANRQLRELQAELEARVELRTSDLTLANEELKRHIAERERTEEALRNSEAQLRQAQKIEAVGRLAGGIAHDFNNLLTVILSYTESSLEGLGENHECAQGLREIRRAGERAADLTRQLLAFSRQQVLEPRLLDLNEVLSEMMRMFERVLGENIELCTSLTPALHKVMADRGKVEQVVMNLVLNARDAMPNGGQLTIESANVLLSEEYAHDHHGVTPGPHVMLCVSDSGVGMDRKTQSRVFEPFFTTKEYGKGNGLGLSTVFGIVQQSGGHIWLYSEPGTGTTFKIYFPRSFAEAEIDLPRAPLPTSARGTETILLVEDEEQVRRATSESLKRQGYEVLEAGGGEEALRICKEHVGPIHLLLTDVIMPRMNGRQIAEQVVVLRPDVRVLFMSGYTDDVIIHHGVLETGASFIQKPITRDVISRKVREVIDSPVRSSDSSRR